MRVSKKEHMILFKGQDFHFSQSWGMMSIFINSRATSALCKAKSWGLTLASSRMKLSPSSWGGASLGPKEVCGAFSQDGPTIIWTKGVGVGHLKASMRDNRGKVGMTITSSSSSMGVMEPPDCGTEVSASIEGPSVKGLALGFLRMGFFEGSAWAEALF